MKAIDKVMIEMKMWQYFSEFSKEGLPAPIFKERHETPTVGGVFLSDPEYDTNYNAEFLEKFFEKKFNQNKRPYESFINHEIITFKHHFNVLFKDPKLPIGLNWLYVLETKMNDLKK
jgi:hypothetical protein